MKTPGPRQKSLFHAEMAKLLEAGFDIRKAADAMRDTRLPKAQEALLEDLHRGLEAGKTITESIGADRGAVSDIERHLIRAGERGGRLAQAFRHLADYYEVIASARGEVVKSLIYPLLILHIGILLASIPGGAVLDGLKASGIAANLARNLAIAYGLGFTLFFVLRFLWNMASHSGPLDRWARRLPWIGRARRDLAMTRFCQVYHACLLSGIAMEETVRLSCGASQSGVVRLAGADLAAVAAAGQPLGPAFRAAGVFPPAFARAYSTAEESGTLDAELARWARYFEKDAASSIRGAATALPKLLYLLILLYVGWRIVSFYTGYYESLERMME